MSGEGNFMFDLFCSEVENNAATLTDGLLKLEQGAADQAGLEALMRAAHSVKGAARIMNLHACVTVAHAMENCFVATQSGTLHLAAGDIDLLLKGVDLLKKIPASADKSTFALPEAVTAEAQALADLISAIGSGKPAPEKLPEPAEMPQKEAVPAQTPQEKPSAPAKTSADGERIVRVGSANMDRIMSLSGELFVQTGQLDTVSRDMLRMKTSADHINSLLDSAFHAAEQGLPARAVELILETKRYHSNCEKNVTENINNFDTLRRQLLGSSGRLYREIIASKMRPFADCVHGFPRMVRDISKTLGKVIKLELEGLNAGIDRDILEKIESPLTHLLRNAIDHGIEAPDVRISGGKPMEGAIKITAWHAAGMLVIEIADDGAGVNFAKLKENIVSKKLTTLELVEKMSEAELLEFIFLPGFSTRDNVTDLSGRGVGLDIVQNMIQEVGGTLHMETKPGQGTLFRLKLPLTLSVIKALLVEIAGEPYAFALSRATHCLQLRRDAVTFDGGHKYISLDGERILFAHGWELLELSPAHSKEEHISMVLLGEAGTRCAIGVDKFLGEHNIAVRPLHRRLGKIRDISAEAVLDDGSPLLILDTDDLLRSAELFTASAEPGKKTAKAGQKARRVLIADDSATVREVQRQILESKGYYVALAVNGMDAWNALRSEDYDLLISDIDMPRMNGLELISKVRADVRLKTMPIIVVSYKDRTEDRERGLSTGADLYLAKSSFQDDTLLQAVEKLTRENSGAA